MTPDTSTTPSRRQLGHEPALDGIRGVAVLLVVLWHYPDDILERKLVWLKSGHLGVDLFFVLSGFLITALMLKEHDRVARISFSGFYRRRAFRLLPALILFLAGHVVWALLTNIPTHPPMPGTDLRNEMATVISSLFFSLNLIGYFGDYSATLGAGHLWSLAVEEQFYLIWPLLTVALLSRESFPFRCAIGIVSVLVAVAAYYFVGDEIGPLQRWGLIAAIGFAALTLLATTEQQKSEVRALVVLATLVAAILMYRIGSYEPGSFSSLTRLYSSLPSRADSLIIGAALAYLWVGGYIPQRCPTLVSLLAGAVFGWCVMNYTLHEPFLFEYGWTLTAVCGALIVWGSLGAQDTMYGRVLSWAWLRAIGKVAYGLYLWHVLVFTAVRHWYGDESILLKTILAVGITAGITAASWFFVERPMLAYKSPRRPKAGSDKANVVEQR